MNKTPGQAAYERDVAKRPTYDGGQPRRQWHELRDYERDSWERNPTDRGSPPTPPHLVHYESAYGTDERLSFAIRVF